MIHSSETTYRDFLNDLDRAREINRENLMKILHDNRATLYGRQNRFRDIDSEEEYTEELPMTEYALYDGKICTPGTFTAYPIHSILATSGTTGKQKMFPITEESLRRYSTYVLNLPIHLSGIGGKTIHTNIFRPPVDNVTILSNCYFGWIRDSGVFDFDSFVGGTDFQFSDRIADVSYVKAWLAIASPDLEAFQSIFLYDLALFFSWFESHWREIVADMRAGRVSVDMSEENKRALLALRPTEEWLCELSAIMEKESDEPLVRRVWKKVRFIGGIGGKMYRFQERALLKFIGDIPLHYSIYASSECMIGVAPRFSVAMSRAEYVLIPGSAYYEFLPKGKDTPVGLADLEIDGEYEPVITTFSGLYRYKTGDIIRICSFIGEAPVFEVYGRKKHLINIAGEKIDGYTATEAVDRWAKAVGIELADFAIGIETEHLPNGYCLFIESDSKDYVAGGGDLFDRILRELSPDYDDLRNLRMIASPDIRIVRRGEIFNSINAAAKVSHKKPRIFIGELATEYLLQLGEKNG